ncbi:MAG: DUF2207 domain-containing protein [Flavobacteriaceae bacterium]
MQKRGFFLFFVVAWSLGQAQGFTVNQFSAEVFLNQEGSFLVNETYHLTFHAYKHGIFRNIQLQYDLKTEEGSYEKRKIKIRKIDVPGHNFVTSNKIRRELEGDVEIKIGDKHKTVFGPQEYKINYTVENAFLHEQNAVQFYWNLKPSNWITTFQKMHFVIHLPEGVSVPPNALKIYDGATGTTQESTHFNVTYSNGAFIVESKAGFVSNYGESVTVLLSLPPEAIIEQVPWWPFGTKYGWTLVLAALLGGFYIVWRKHGKDDSVMALTSYYPPNGMDPALAGFLIDDRSDTRDLISLLPYWGSKGFITIEEIDKKGWFAKDDTKLTRIASLPKETPSYERKMFQGLFATNEVLVSSLKDTFYKTMQAAKLDLKDAAQPYYMAKSRKVMYYTAGALVLLFFTLSIIVLLVWGLLASVLVAVSCVVLLIMNSYMIKKNPKGNEVLATLKGFKQFIKLSELKKLELLVKEDPRYFEDTMAYAMAFGLFDKWANKFNQLNVAPPTWYHSHTAGVFTMHHFSNSFSSAMTSAQSTMVSSPSSSGGGSSGGGFGGGGGGSW